jgi:tetratricopeptide (TPR) repeat protein
VRRQSFACSAGMVVLICFTLPTPARAQELSDLPKIEPEISASAASTLEDKLKTNPDDLGSRAQLLDYYFVLRISNRSADIEQKRESHIFWVIEHHPESDLAGTPQAEILPLELIESADGYQRAKQLWLEQIEKHPSDTRVLRNGASFFTTSDPKLSRELLDRAALANPADRETMAMLAQSYELQTARIDSRDQKKDLAEKALALREQVLDQTDQEKRFNGLEEVAVDAFDAGDTVKAQQYASELLSLAPKFKNSWNYGNAIHKGNEILGLVAFQHDDIPGAKKYLLASGDTPGSPQLNSFGPNMSLAKALFEKGEVDTVVVYLESCKKFWKMGGTQLQNWIVLVKGGGTPDFSANLNY